MNSIIKKIEQNEMKKDIPEFNVGDTVRVYAKVVEGTRERTQVFEGVCIKKQNGGVRESFTVRRLSYGVGVEKSWPLHSPRVENVEVVRRGIVRRARLYYLRDKIGKKARIREVIGGKPTKAEKKQDRIENLEAIADVIEADTSVENNE